jgi:hypothetical protein
MQKIQILFPDPVRARLRAVARQQDRPVSELVRRAVDRLLEQVPALPPEQPARFPTFRGGGIRVDADRLKDVLHGFDEGVRPAGRSDSRRSR